jgi:UDP-GlcNAc:undecaprenyl-phosphate GlcNAc-1-phosphate transferase
MVDMYLLTLAISIAIGAAATLILLALSRTERFLRLFHVRGEQERPRWGGVVFLATFALTPFIASAVSGQAEEIFSPRSGSFMGLLAATSLVFYVGFLDDVRLTSPYLRLAVFVSGASAAFAAGYRIEEVGVPGGYTIDFGYASFVVTVLWIVAMTNAINFIDGRDGVSIGVAIFALVTLAAVGQHSDHPTVALLLIALAGAGLGFLPFNLPPASAFVGDSGAYVLGFVLGTLSIRASTGPTDQVFVLVPLVALGYPLLDLVLQATKRMLHHQHPMIGDADHIHDRLEQYGAGPRGTLVVIWGIAALFSVGSILIHWVDETWMEATVLAAVLAIVSAVVLRLGYLITIWNSRSVVWLRQRVFAPQRPE